MFDPDQRPTRLAVPPLSFQFKAVLFGKNIPELASIPPPKYPLPPTPTPPATVKAPLVVELEDVLDAIASPVEVKVPITSRFDIMEFRRLLNMGQVIK